MPFLLGLFVSIVGVFCPCSGETRPLHAYSPGDIIIGGLFPIHLQTDRNTTHEPLFCSKHNLQMFLNSQMMVYTIREINQRIPRLLPNFTIGYDMHDTCSDVSFAIRATLELLKERDPQSCPATTNVLSALPEPRTKAVIGASHSEISIAVARIFALKSVAQISYASTSEVLSSKWRFPSFLRTIASDEFQTKAIAELVSQFNWKTVAIVGSDDEYGKYGTDRLVDLFREGDICIEFTDILSGNFAQNNSQALARLDKLMSNIQTGSAEAIIIFTKLSNVAVIMKEAISRKINRTWVAGDSWSTSSNIYELPGIEKIGEVFGFISKRNEVPGFRDYVISLFNGTTDNISKHFLSDDYEHDGSKTSLNLSRLANDINQDASYNTYLAVQVIAEGLRSLLKCDNQRCQRDANFTAAELLMEIKKVNFTVNNTTHLFFNENGDPHLGYDIMYWDMTEPKHSLVKTIGEYVPDVKIKLPDYLVKKMQSVNVTCYNCSKRCEPGHELIIKEGKQCCKHCVQCAEGQFYDLNEKRCEPCGQREYSSPQRDVCLNKTANCLEWSHPFIIILTCLEVFGIIVTITIAILFAIHRNTPIVKSVGGYLCFLELLSLLVCFCLTFSFTGIPTKASCMVGMPLFCIAFSLCISCILANLLQILVGFHFDVGSGSWIKKLNRPLAVVTIVPGIQLVLCVLWLRLYPPSLHEHILPETILWQCHKGSNNFFIAMLAYNAFLAIVCFLFAYKGKQLPDLYKNASLISISMLLYLIIWILFIPIHISLFGEYKQAIKGAAIIVSSYSILGFHLAPKCYIMLFRKEMNNENAITEYIKNHYEMRNIAVVRS